MRNGGIKTIQSRDSVWEKGEQGSKDRLMKEGAGLFFITKGIDEISSIPLWVENISSIKERMYIKINESSIS